MQAPSRIDSVHARRKRIASSSSVRTTKFNPIGGSPTRSGVVLVNARFNQRRANPDIRSGRSGQSPKSRLLSGEARFSIVGGQLFRMSSSQEHPAKSRSPYIHTSATRARPSAPVIPSHRSRASRQRVRSNAILSPSRMLHAPSSSSCAWWIQTVVDLREPPLACFSLQHAHRGSNQVRSSHARSPRRRGD